MFRFLLSIVTAVTVALGVLGTGILPTAHAAATLANGPAHFSAQLTAGAPARLGQVRYIKRSLMVQPPGARRERGRVNMALFNQYFLATGANSKASIGFLDGSVIHMKDHTNIVLRNPHLTKLVRGTVAEYLAAGNDHRIQTATGQAGAIGTTFLVNTTGNKSTYIVLHGALQVSNNFGKVVVKSGHESTTVPDRAPSLPTKADARAAFAWTAGIPTPDLGEDVALDANGGRIVGFSSQHEGPSATWSVEHINDGLLSDGWETAAGKTTNQWVKLGFQSDNQYRISDVIIDPAATHGDSPSADLKDFEIRVSNTGTADGDFTTVYRGTAKQEDSLQRFTFPVPERAKYLELYARNNYGDPAHLAVAEIEVVATTSLFSAPKDIAVDGKGNIYVADADNDRIQKINQSGKTLAIFGGKGRAPGQFLKPAGIALDRHGNIYVADTNNNRIQKLSPSGKPLAHWGAFGIDPRQFVYPEGVAVDSKGNIYVADTVNARIQKISPQGKFVGLWSNSYYQWPVRLTIDRNDNIYVADEHANKVFKVSSSGNLLRTFGGSAAAALSQPEGIGVNAQGDVYVISQGSDKIQEFSPSGKLLRAWGKLGFRNGQFIFPGGLGLDSHGNVYATDSDNGRVQKFSPTGRFLAVWGKSGTIPQVLGEPAGIASDGRGNIYVTDDVNDRVQQRASSNGDVQAVYGYHGFVEFSGRAGLGQFYYPHGIAVATDGAMYVADTFNDRIQILSNRGPIGAFGSRGSGPGQFYWPEGVAVDRAGNVYVADTYNNRIQKLTPDGSSLAVWGSAGSGPGQFNHPTSIAVDSRGYIYVVDTGNDRVEKLAPDGSWVADLKAVDTSISGTLKYPLGVTVDGQDNVYVANTAAGTILKFGPDGSGLATFHLPGSFAAGPVGVTVDQQGYSYVIENFNSEILKLAPDGTVVATWF